MNRTRSATTMLGFSLGVRHLGTCLLNPRIGRPGRRKPGAAVGPGHTVHRGHGTRGPLLGGVPQHHATGQRTGQRTHPGAGARRHGPRHPLQGVAGAGEGGLLGITSDGQGRLYAHSTAVGGNRIQRFTITGNPGAPALGGPETVIDGTPSASYHDDGRIPFGPDGAHPPLDWRMPSPSALKV